MPKLKHKRNEKGALGALMMAALVLIICGLGALALDISHVNTVRGELQNAVDAAALAGAEDLSSDVASANAEANALKVAAQNTADGKSISNNSANTTVLAQTNSSASGGGSMEVTATMVVHHMLAPIFGRNSDSISAKGSAEYAPTLNRLGTNQAFPIAVSLDDTSHGAALQTLNVGDSITIAIEPSGGNACWTSCSDVHPSTTVLRAVLDGTLGVNTSGTGAPSMSADGDTTIDLTQGLHNGVDLTGDPYSSLMTGRPFCIFPVISGGNPYNKARELLGFICVKVSSITKKSDSITLTGKLVKGLAHGQAGDLPSEAAGNLSDLSPAVVHLIQGS